MELNKSQLEELKNKVQLLAPIISGLRKALESLPLNDSEKTVIWHLVETYGDEYEAARKELKKARKKNRKNNNKKSKARVKSSKLSKKKISLNYHKKRAKEIERVHKISGFKRKRTIILQGGAPGLGKKS